jgi:5-methylcytosine-specific restriction endonuclease McrA
MGDRQEFSQKTKLEAWRRSGGHCASCGKKIRTGDGPEYDHIITDFYNGGNSLANCQVLCKACHAMKTGDEDAPKHAKTRRYEKRAAKAERPKKKMSYRKFDGTPVWK